VDLVSLSANEGIGSQPATGEGAGAGGLGDVAQRMGAASLEPQGVRAASGYDAAEVASALGTGMNVRRVTQPGKRQSCNACGVQFDSSEAHKGHHRTDWHRLNLKRRVAKAEALSLEEFEAIPAKQREAMLSAD
jgi:hypothetical protein